MALIDKETIRAEIERRLSNIVTGLDFTAEIELKGLLSFLDSVPPIQSLNKDHIARIIELWEDVEHDAEWCNEPSEFMYDEVLRRFNLDTLLESAKRGYKDCNGCEYNRTVKDQIGWQFRGCFGGEYKGKPIAEIALCPLKVATLPEQPVEGLDVTDFCKPIDPDIAKCVADHWWKMISEESTNTQPVEGLEEEIRRWIHAQRNNGRKLFGWIDMVELAARHFAEWGAEHLRKNKISTEPQ